MARRFGWLTAIVLSVAVAVVVSGCSSSSTGPSPAAEPGEVHGYVVHALTGLPIEGATVTVDGESRTTNSSGYYAVEEVDPGNVTVEASFADFVTVNSVVAVGEGASVRQDCVLIPSTEGNEYRIVLTWGENPADLDSHLWIPLGGGNMSHVYFGNRGSIVSEPFAELDVDDVSGYGPETITAFPAHEGQYIYGVYHFSGTGTLQSSGATVRVYQGNTLRHTLTAPNETCGDHWWWNVCTFNAQSGDITVVNSLEAYAPYSGGPMAMTK